MRERLERQLYRSFERGKFPSSSIPLGQSVFTQMDSEDRAVAVAVAGQKDVFSEDLLSDLFGHLNINIRPPILLSCHRNMFWHILLLLFLLEIINPV